MVGVCVLRLTRPLQIQQRNRIGKVRALSKQQLPLRLIELQLRRIQRHHIQRNPRRKHLLRRLNIHRDVVLSLRPTRRQIAKIVISPPHRSTHHHNPLQLLEGLRIAIKRRTQIRHRPQRDQRKLPRLLPDLLQQKVHRLRMLTRRLPLRPPSLRESATSLAMFLNTHRNRNIAAPRLTQQSIKQFAREAPYPPKPK